MCLICRSEIYFKTDQECCRLCPDLVQAAMLCFLFFQSEVLALSHTLGSKSQTPENNLDLLKSLLYLGKTEFFQEAVRLKPYAGSSGYKKTTNPPRQEFHWSLWSAVVGPLIFRSHLGQQDWKVRKELTESHWLISRCRHMAAALDGLNDCFDCWFGTIQIMEKYAGQAGFSTPNAHVSGAHGMVRVVQKSTSTRCAPPVSATFVSSAIKLMVRSN